MRILFLSHYYPPEVNAPANRLAEHARCWVKQGHSVTVITGVPNHPRGELFPGYRNRWHQEEWIDGVRVVRTWMYLTPNEGFARRTLNYVLFAFTAVLASLRLERPDVVVATSPQFFCGLAGAVVARLKRRPFVLEVRDLWPDSVVELGQLRNATAIAALRWLERTLYRSADGIVVVTAAFLRHITACGVPAERLALVYNGIDTARFQPRPVDEELRRQRGLEGRFAVAYLGTLGLAHGLETVIDAAERLRDEPELHFVFVGDGAERGRLESLAARRGLENVTFTGLQPREEIPAWIASMDLLLVMLKDLAVFETVIPSKIFEFLAQERPVVLAARGEIRRLVEQAEVAYAIDPENVDQLVAAIRRVRARPEEAAGLARSGRRWVETDFRREDRADEMAAFLERVVESAG